MRHPNKKNKPKHKVVSSTSRALKQVKREVVEQNSSFEYAVFSEREYIRKVISYKTEKFFKRKLSVLKTTDWVLNEVSEAGKERQPFKFKKYKIKSN